MIEAGQLVGEREIIGGSRDRYRVRFETPQDAPGDAPETRQSPSTDDAPETPHDAPAATTRALEILAASLDAERAERQRLAVDLLAAIERAARAEAEAAAAQQRAEMQASQIAEERERGDELRAEVERLRARRWWRWR